MSVAASWLVVAGAVFLGVLIAVGLAMLDRQRSLERLAQPPVRRLLIAAAAALALVGSQAHAGAAPTWAERFERVRYRSHTWHHERFSIRENRLTVHAAAARLGAPEACMVAIVNRESGWNEHAQNPSSSAAGLFQFVEGTLGGRAPPLPRRGRPTRPGGEARGCRA